MKLIQDNVYRGMGLDHLKTNFWGVEIELEGYDGNQVWPKDDYNEAKTRWLLENDHSLRNGIEFVSVRQTQTRMSSSLDIAQRAIKHRGLKTSKRCGVHVHMNALNLTWGELYSVMALYVLLEPELFKYFAPERNENHFCVPLHWNTNIIQVMAKDMAILRMYNSEDINYDPPAKKKPKKGLAYTLHSTVNTSNAHDITFDAPPPGLSGRRFYPLKGLLRFPGHHKYSAMTGYRLHDLGTLEFRSLPGTENMDDVKLWLKTLAKLKARGSAYKDPLLLQKAYERQGSDYFWDMLDLGDRPYVNSSDKEDAEEAAFKLIGKEPVRKEDLDWSL